jgi:hypothetical protein
MKTKGLKPKDRKLATTTKKTKLTANQWQNTPRQLQFMQYWFDPESPTHSNAYKSALRAGYSPYTANKITSISEDNKWIGEYRRNIAFKGDHVIQGIETIAKKRTIDSKSPDDTRLKAYEALAKITGVLDTKNTTNINIVQPILSSSSVKGEVIEGTKV